MIHRALFGSVERFFAILLEHYAGALPTWLMPTQVVVLPVRDDHDALCRRGGRRRCARPGCGSRSTPPTSRSGAGSGRWKLEKVPYILVVGDDDVAAGTVGVNARSRSAPSGAWRSTTSSPPWRPRSPPRAHPKRA